ncbi:MAG: TRAP transporter large permease, partial [Planctomycetes bacterium]|nr:TRAP transporter large permease [Planctomycetota bacterium]
LYLGMTPVVVFQRLTAGMNIFSLMAVPFFIYAGELILRGGIADKLIRLASALVGHVRGGLGVVNVATSIFLGGVSGSAIADASAVGSIMIPQMQARGYPVEYSVSVTVTSAVISLILPPSHNMIIYSNAAGGMISIADLFTAGILPGVLLAVLLMATAAIVARFRGYPAEKFPGAAQLARIAAVAFPGLLLVGIIIGGVRSGIFTATESSVIAVAYAFFVTLVVYRSLGWNEFLQATAGAVRTTAMVLMLIGGAASFGWFMALFEVPRLLIAFMHGISDNPYVIYLLINMILLFLGCFMDMSPLIIICTPIFLPVVTAYGMDPVHFGMVLILNLGIGICTPPVGTVLFVGCAIGKIPVTHVVRSIWPFYTAGFLALMLVTYVPAISLAFVR